MQRHAALPTVAIAARRMLKLLRTTAGQSCWRLLDRSSTTCLCLVRAGVFVTTVAGARSQTNWLRMLRKHKTHTGRQKTVDSAAFLCYNCYIGKKLFLLQGN